MRQAGITSFEDAVAPHLADDEEVFYLVEFRQGQGIFTDYLAVTDTKVDRRHRGECDAFNTGSHVSVDHQRVRTTRHPILRIDGRRRAINYIKPKGKAAEIAAFIAAHL